MRWFKKRRLYRTRDNSFVIFRNKAKFGSFAGSFIFTNLLTGESFPVSVKRKNWLRGLVDCKANVKCRVTKYD